METVLAILNWALDHWEQIGALLAALVGVLAARKGAIEAKASQQVAVANAVAVERLANATGDATIKEVAANEHRALSPQAKAVLEPIIGIAEEVVNGKTAKSTKKPGLEVLGKVIGIAKKVLLSVLIVGLVVGCVTTRGADGSTTTTMDAAQLQAMIAVASDLYSFYRTVQADAQERADAEAAEKAERQAEQMRQRIELYSTLIDKLRSSTAAYK